MFLVNEGLVTECLLQFKKPLFCFRRVMLTAKFIFSEVFAVDVVQSSAAKFTTSRATITRPSPTSPPWSSTSAWSTSNPAIQSTSWGAWTPWPLRRRTRCTRSMSRPGSGPLPMPFLRWMSPEKVALAFTTGRTCTLRADPRLNLIK